MTIATLIPNDPPLCLRQKLIDASKCKNPKERELAISAATKEIRERHPELFWSSDEVESMTSVWGAERMARHQKSARDAELARLMKGSEHAYA